MPALLVAATLMLSGAPPVWADNDHHHDRDRNGGRSYSFTKLAELGGPAPGGGYHINDYEPGALNNRGDVLYGTDLGTSADPTTWFGEGVFLLRDERRSPLELARSTGNAPGGGTFDSLLLGTTSLNDHGDAAFAFTLSPFSFPVGVNSGLYRYSRHDHNVIPVVRSGVTRAPAGGTFAGVFFNTSLNNDGDLVFTGIIATDKGVHFPDEPYVGLGMGIFKTDRSGRIISVVSPGDAVPGGGQFDLADGGWINESRDVAFFGHVAGEEARIDFAPPQATIIGTLGSVYVKKAGSGKIISISHQGDVAPGGGVFRSTYGPMINDRGDVVFSGDLSPAPHLGQVAGVYLYSGHKTIALARPGDLMPGGGTFVTASIVGAGQVHINSESEVAFNAGLDRAGAAESGVFVWSHGLLRLVAGTGTEIPGVGTIAQMTMFVEIVPPPPSVTPNSGAINNDEGQVLFGATLTDGRGVLLLASPRDR